MALEAQFFHVRFRLTAQQIRPNVARASPQRMKNYRADLGGGRACVFRFCRKHYRQHGLVQAVLAERKTGPIEGGNDGPRFYLGY